jgi:N-acetylmuramoyl-L-alanine amidase
MILKIALMPGHVNKDSGAIDNATDDDIYTIEALFNQKVVDKICWIGMDISDIAVLQVKGSFKNRFKTIQEFQPHLVIDIHHNSSIHTTATGFEVYYRNYDTDSQRLAELIKITHMKYCTMITARGIYPHNPEWGIFKPENINSLIPTVLIECGYISNPIEEKLLHDSSIQVMEALSVIQGILLFKQEKGW